MEFLRVIINRPDEKADQLAIEHSLKVVTECIRVLQSHEPPDTFCGRRNHDPVPLPHQEE